MSTEQLGALIGVGRMVITNLENGKRHITLDEAVAIAAALGLTLNDMISVDPVKLTNVTEIP